MRDKMMQKQHLKRSGNVKHILGNFKRNVCHTHVKDEEI